MWLPRTFYESLPFVYLVLGVIALGTAFYMEAWYWAEILAVSGTVSMVIGLMLLLRRKGYRASRSRLDFDDPGGPPG